MKQYPQTLIEALDAYGAQPSYDIEWDRALLHTLRTRGELHRGDAWFDLHGIVTDVIAQKREATHTHDLSDPDVFEAHRRLVHLIADNIVLGQQRRRFECDDYNRQAIRFLIYYFNDCPLAEEVYPCRGYKLHKNLMLQGSAGVGKTLLMQVFSEYTHRLNLPKAFQNVSVTQMVNYYTMHNNLDLFTYNEEGNKGFQAMPANVCLNDIGIQGKMFYGTNTDILTEEFLHARNEIWTNYGRFAHLTTNLGTEELAKRYADRYERLIDRFKTYNIIPLAGDSRR